MEVWRQYGEQLRRWVNPETFPVAVKFLDREADIPQTAKRPVRDLRVKMAPCQGSAMARRYGWTVAFTREDVGCAIAAHSYGWERVTDAEGPVHFLTLMNYADDAESAARILDGFLTLETDHDPIVLYSPLERTKIEPDVVLIYVNPAQLMRLIHGMTHHEGTPIESRFSGRAASCTEGVLGAYLDQAPKVVVPGNGDRVWAACQDHEMIMAIPGGQLAQLVEGLEKTHRTGIRYPIPSFLRYQPEVGFAIPLADIFKPEEADKLARRRKR